jgi:acyl-CoA reductase-like NAD-dependent aldehyde dehydrogenase
MFASIVDNGGRSCVNASGVWAPRHGREIAEALAKRVASVTPRAADDERAQIAPFVDANVAGRINRIIDNGLVESGAVDVTAAQRAERLQVWEGCSYLLPTIVFCESPDHPMANKEFLFPFASVVEVPSAELPEALGPSLVVSAITNDQNLIAKLVSASNVDRLNIGAVATNHLSWDQPHEGNLFDHLYARRAFQLAKAG